MKARFLNGLNCSEPITLTNVISYDNIKQSDQYLVSFINLVNQHKERIDKIIFIETSYLQRYYINEFYENKIDLIQNDWNDKNKSNLKLLKVPYEINHWSSIVKNSNFDNHKNFICSEYNKKEKPFKDIIDSVASKFSKKCSLNAAINYLLEECAAIFLINGYLTYPGKLNSALQYILDNFNLDLKYISYDFKNNPKKTNSIMNDIETTEIKEEYCPSFFGKTIAYYADSLSLNKKNKTIFMKDFSQLCYKFISNNEKEVDEKKGTDGSNIIEFSQRNTY